MTKEDIFKELQSLREQFLKLLKKQAEDKEIQDRYPPLPPELETKVYVTSPTETTEVKTGRVGMIPNPRNHIESAINRLREKL